MGREFARRQSECFFGASDARDIEAAPERRIDESDCGQSRLWLAGPPAPLMLTAPRTTSEPFGIAPLRRTG